MRQELVIKDNQILRGLIRKKIILYWHNHSSLTQYKSILEDIEDFLLPSLVYYFYLEKENYSDFCNYIENINLKEKSFNHITKVINNYLDCYEEIQGKPIGDIHPGGSTKYLKEHKVLYNKFPDYGDLLSNLSSEIFDDYKKFFPKITKSKQQILRDYVPINLKAKDENTVCKYYFNLGRIIPFLLFIRAIDINAENMIINLPYPVFFDMEAIFSGKFADKSKVYNLKRTGIVKMEEKEDTSVLTGGIKSRDSLLKPLICGNIKAPYIRWRTQSKGKYSNLPKIGKSYAHPSKYLKSIKKGYYETSTKLLSQRKKLLNITKESEAYVRVIIRPTRMYRYFLLKSCYPQIYLHQNLNSFFSNNLQNCNLIYKVNDGNLLDTEIKALLKSQVPAFYSNFKKKTILSPKGEKVTTWNNSPFKIWSQYQKTLNLQFFEKQIETLESCIR